MSEQPESSEPEIFIKYSSYTPAQKRATQKYRSQNKEKVNEQRKAYYKTRKETDPNFIIYKREKAKEYYQRKKMQKNATVNDVEISTDTDDLPNFNKEDFEKFCESISNTEPEPEPIIEEVIPTPPPETAKPKRTRKSKKADITPEVKETASEKEIKEFLKDVPKDEEQIEVKEVKPKRRTKKAVSAQDTRHDV